MRMAAALLLLSLVSQTAVADEGYDLYLLIGQSNMAGRGKLTDEERKPVDGVFVLNAKDQWVPAAHPLHFDKPKIAGYGLGLDFAKAIRGPRPVGLIPCAFGGTSLDQWKPGGKLYKEAVRRTKLAQKSGTLRGILWHQGESDTKNDELANSYAERFVTFVGDLRKDLDAANVPLVAGELGRYLKNPRAQKINEQLHAAQPKIPQFDVASSEGLVHKGDNTHFDTPSLATFGKRYAEAMKRLQAK